MKAFIVLVALACAAPAFARTMDRCSLAKEQRSMVRAKAGAAQARATRTMKAFILI